MTPSSQTARTAPTPVDKEKSVTDSLELLTPEELAELLKVKLSWIYDQVEAGHLPVLRLNRRLRFRPADVSSFLDRTTTS